jgi:hypothetical protein
MIITNKANLPTPLVSFLTQDWVSSPGTYRVTELLKSTREILLVRRHENEIEQDVSEMIWLLFGTAVHSVLESAQEGANQIKEARLSIRFPNGKVSGQFDLYDADKKQIIDYKTASVWKFAYNDFDDWREQMLSYAVLLKHAGFEVESGEIVVFVKDHAKSKAKYDAGYPQIPVQCVHFEFTQDEIDRHNTCMRWKIDQLYDAKDIPDDKLAFCTDKERWNTGTKYAVMKKGRKAAMRVLHSESAAIIWKEENGGDRIEKRVGEDKKCQDYCLAKEFCNQWKAKRFQEEEE